jgi:uncharacterized protein DUF6925
MDLHELVVTHLRSAKSSWSIGALGAIAEFLREPSEPVDIDGVSAVTARGAIAVGLPSGCRAFGDERVLALCLPEPEARMGARTRITSLGRDRDALRAQDRDALLFDLGLGLANCEFCVRTADAALVDALRAAGRAPLLENAPLVELLKRASPHRVVRSRAGRIEVFQDIAPEGGRSPSGPHTHLLPRLLQEGRTHAADVPIPEGWLPCLSLYPPDPGHAVEDAHQRVNR